MAKTNKARKSKKTARKNNSGVVSRIKTQLDEGARQWLRLLSDPCRAPLVQPCYESAGTGLLFRAHSLFTPDPTATDFVLEFSPCQSGSFACRYGWSNTVGGPLGTAGNIEIGGLFGTTPLTSPVGRARCAAACIKIVYTGKEVDRQGVIAGTLDAGVTYTWGETIAWKALEAASNMPKLERFGQQSHEYRWFPGQADAEFVAYDSEEGGNLEFNGNSVQVALVGANPGKFYVDIVSVWEWQPKEELASGMVALLTRPPSSMTFNAITRAVGDLGRWAVAEVGEHMPAIMASMAGPAARIGAQFAALTV